MTKSPRQELEELVMEAPPRRVYAVTGATSGLGAAIATQLATDGARVLVGARSVQSGEAAVARMRTDVPNAEFDVVAADLSEMAQVRTFGERVRQQTNRLDGLILNAAEARPDRLLTGEGLETNIATNYLSGFLLTHLLLPLLRSSAPARVVTISSSRHTRVNHIEFPALVAGTGPKRGGSYPASKLLTLLFTTEFARRAVGTEVTANAADPGFVRSNLGRHATGVFGVFLKATRIFQDTPEKAAATPVWLAASPQVAGISGGYYSRYQSAKASELARDHTSASRLWEQTTELLVHSALASAAELDTTVR